MLYSNNYASLNSLYIIFGNFLIIITFSIIFAMNSRLNRVYLTNHYQKPSDLDTIMEESYWTKTQALSNSQKFSLDMENSMKMGVLTNSMNIANGSMVLPKTNRLELSENNSPRNKSGIFITSPRQKQTQPNSINTDVQIITVNNRRFVTSKSPSKKNQAEEIKIVHPLKPIHKNAQVYNQSPVKLRSNFVQSSPPSKKLTVESKKYSAFSQQQANLVKKYEDKISQLVKKLGEMEEEKKYSIVNLLKERLQLKDIIERSKKENKELRQLLVLKSLIIEKLQEKSKENKSESDKNTTKKLLQMEMDDDNSRLREQNQALLKQISALKKELEESKLGNKIEVFERPSQINLPRSDSDGSEVSMVIGANWQNLLQNVMAIQRINIQQSREEVKEDTEQYHIDEIIANIQELTSKNRDLLQTNNELQIQNEQLHRKLEQLSEKVVQQEGQLELRDIIGKETARVLKNISAVVTNKISQSEEPKNAEKSMRKIQEILQQVKEEEQGAQQGTIIEEFLSSYA